MEGMSDKDSSGRAAPRQVGPAQSGEGRPQRHAQPKRGRRGRLIAVLGAAAAAILALVLLWPRLFGGPALPADFTGEGKDDILIEVTSGESGRQIAENLKELGVIADVGPFISAAAANPKMDAIQPGFYRVRTQVPAATAVAQLTDPQNRVGKLVIPEGRQLDDIEYIGNGAVTQGIFSLISDASCVDLNGTRTCVSAQDLKAAAGEGSLESLGVPDWALEGAGAMGTSHRRLEGLIAPGTWNIDPTADPAQILGTLVAQSGDRYEAGGLLDAASSLNISPYEVLIVGSLVQKEALPADFAKVARVIYNRLDSDYDRLEFDSTVNYPLERQEVATTDADRAAETPWNTYAMSGLPATPICSPGDEALAAAERPEPGDWLYFVTIDDEGTTLFTGDYQEHLANRDQALSSGVLDHGR